MEIAGTTPGTQYDQLLVTGSASLGGTLQVNALGGFEPAPGDAYVLLRTMAGVTGTFANALLPALPPGLSWRLDYGPLDVRLLLEGSAIVLPGDYNRDGAVGAADFVIWRKALSSGNLRADGNGDGRVDGADYLVWRYNFADRVPSPAAGALASVPEPASLFFALIGMIALTVSLRRR
jgi:hypothetical protein